MITNEYLDRLVEKIIQDNYNRLNELFEMENMTYSYEISFGNFNNNIGCYISFIDETKNFCNRDIHI